MPRRVVFLIAVAVLALLATAIVPWTLTGGGVVGAVAQHLRDGYGLDLEVRGRSTVALLPVPRVKFEGITLKDANGIVAVNGGTVRGEVRLLPLLVGRLELSELVLSGSRIALSGNWVGWLAGLGTSPASGTLGRLVVTGTSIRAGAKGGLDDVNVVVNWSGGDSKLDIAGWTSWRGERVEITQGSLTPLTLAAGKLSPFSFAVVGPGGHVSVTGEAQIGADPRISGSSTIAIRSMRDFTRWSGAELPLASVVSAISIEGDFSADRRRLTWPSVTVKLGPDTLEGTLALRFEGSRPVVTGTLAAESLDLSPMFAPLAQSRTPAGWSGESLSLTGLTGGDLDLRVSAAEATVGRMKLTDLAAGVMVRPGRMEASLGRALLNKGSVKGRLTLTADGSVTDVKAQGAFERVELGSLTADLGRSRWITGPAHGHFSLEGSGASAAEVARQIDGRASIAVRQGELVGIGLNDALRLVEKRPLAASMDWKGGRTPFDLAHMNFAVKGGVGEVTEAALQAATLRTSVRGRVSLPDWAVALRAHVDPAAPGPLPSPLIVFDVSGALNDVTITPDARSLIERSGAAKPLFGDRIPAAPPSAPVATAQ